MGSLFLSARRAVPVWMACTAFLAGGLGATPSAGAASQGPPPSVGESAAVRGALANEVQQPGTLVEPEGRSGSQPEPAGQLDMNRATAYSDTWKQLGGLTATRYYMAQVNYRAADKSWRAIDTTLVPGLGGYENAANGFALRIPESLTAGISLSSEGGSVSFSPIGAATAPAAVSGSTASYREALPGTDLEYISEPDGVQEFTTLKSSQAPQRIAYQLSLSSGLRPQQASDGSIAVVNVQGTRLFSIPAPSGAPTSNPTGAHVLPSKLQLDQAGWVLTVDLSEPWLRTALSKGPVRIDPTIKLGVSGEHCTLAEEAPKTSTCESKPLKVGYDSTHKEHHGLVTFAGGPSTQTRILHATLALKQYAHTTSNAKPVAIYPVSRKWTYRLSAGATWNEYETGHNWTTPGGDYLKPPENNDGVVNPSVGATNTTYYWYPTKIVQKWANTPNAPNEEGYANDGFIIKDETDNTVANQVEFENSPGSYLEITSEPTGEGTATQYTYVTEPLTDHSTLSVNVGSGDLMVRSNDMEIPGMAGMDFHSVRTWNSFNGDPNPYSQWTDSNFSQNEAVIFPDGTIAIEALEGGWFTFIHQAEHKFIRPPGLHAYLCEEGSPEPCSPTEKFPTGEKYRLNYQESGNYIYYNAEAGGNGLHNRFGDSIAAEYPTAEKALYTDTHGHKIEELINKDHHITEIKDLTGGRAAKYTYNGTGAAATLETYTDPNGAKTTYTYTGGKGEPVFLTKITNPSGQVTQLTYNAKTQVTAIYRTTNELHTTGPTTRFVYYAVGQAPGKYCASTQEATIVRDPDWTKPAKEETGEKFVLAPHETLYCTNVLEEVERTFDANGNETKNTYDKYENPQTRTAPARETGAERGVSTMIYDKTGQDRECDVITNTAPTSCPTESLKEGYSTSAAYMETAFVFQPSSATSATRNTTGICYYGGAACEGGGKEGAGEHGALKQTTQPGKAADFHEYEKDGNVSASVDYNGNKTSYGYEALGNLATITPPAGSGLGKTTITYDSENRRHTITTCLASTGETCTSSETETLAYDKADRLTEAIYTGPQPEKTIKYKYAADGWLEERTDPVGTTKDTRDPLGRLTQESLPGGVSNAYSYDEASNLETFTDAGGTTHYLYDGLNQLEKLYEPGGKCAEPEAKCIRFTYDKDGALLKTTYPSGAAMSYKLGALTGRVTAAEALGPKGETLLAHSYGYNDIGKGDAPLIAEDHLTAPGGVKAEVDYSYDALDRLTQAITKSETAEYKSCYVYHYDADGNRTKQESSPASNSCTGHQIFNISNSGNQLQCRATEPGETCPKNASEVATYTYNGAGNETKISGTETGNTTFSYNNLDQLKAVTPPGEAEQAATFLGSGQTLMSGLGTVSLQNSLLGTTKQTNSSGTSYYARTPEGVMVDERLPTASYNPIYDAQGDVVGLLNAAGELVQRIRYGPYGENTNTSGTSYSATTDPFLFQGGYHTPGGGKGEGNMPNGLYHFGERYYDPTSGQWTQTDPLGGGYEFAGDDPINMVDPTGTISVVLPSSYPCFVRKSKACKAAEADLKGSESEGEFWSAVGKLGEYGAASLLPEVDVEGAWARFTVTHRRLAKYIENWLSTPAGSKPSVTVVKQALKDVARFLGGG